MVPVNENLRGKGGIRNPSSNNCIDTLSSKEVDMKAGLYPCANGRSENQVFYFTKAYNELRREGTFGARWGFFFFLFFFLPSSSSLPLLLLH